MTRTTMELIDVYWDAAFAEGKEGRTHDTKDGTAQKTRAALEQRIKELELDAAMLAKISSWTGGGIEVSLDAWKAADKDAKRYRWLRENCDWTKGEMVFTHIENVRLGSMCPSLELLDECVDRKLSEAALTKAVKISQEDKLP